MESLRICHVYSITYSNLHMIGPRLGGTAMWYWTKECVCRRSLVYLLKVFLAHANKIMSRKWQFIICERFFSLVFQVINQIGLDQHEKTSRIAALGPTTDLSQLARHSNRWLMIWHSYDFSAYPVPAQRLWILISISCCTKAAIHVRRKQYHHFEQTSEFILFLLKIK